MTHFYIVVRHQPNTSGRKKGTPKKHETKHHAHMIATYSFAAVKKTVTVHQLSSAKVLRKKMLTALYIAQQMLLGKEIPETITYKDMIEAIHI